MARIYTARSIADGGILAADDINVEQDAALAEFNGNLDSNNLPLEAFKRSGNNIQVPTYAAVGVQKSSVGVANSYYRSESTGVKFSLDLSTDSHVPGWNRVRTTSGQDAGCVLEFDAREGMLKGIALINIERRGSFLSSETGGTTVYPAHSNDRKFAVSVRVNGVMVAESGDLYPRRTTICLPWATPIGTQPVVIDTWWKAEVRPMTDAGTYGGTTIAYPSPAEQFPPITMYECVLWARNQVR